MCLFILNSESHLFFYFHAQRKQCIFYNKIFGWLSFYIHHKFTSLKKDVTFKFQNKFHFIFYFFLVFSCTRNIYFCVMFCFGKKRKEEEKIKRVDNIFYSESFLLVLVAKTTSSRTTCRKEKGRIFVFTKRNSFFFI